MRNLLQHRALERKLSNDYELPKDYPKAKSGSSSNFKADSLMLPVVSFMKKMVKNSDTGQQEMVTTNKLTRLKQTLTTGFQQAQDSVAKFSPKSIHVGVGEIAGRQQSNKEPLNEASTIATSDILNKDALNSTNPQPALLNISIGTKTCSGPPNRLTSCRVCVRSLSTGNSDVSYRICSQCNLKVCEDCASYSELDKDIERNFWRCSVCRRRNQGASSPMLSSIGAAGTGVTRQQPLSAAAHRWSEEKAGSLSTSTDDYNKRSKELSATPGSAPVSRRERRSTSGESVTTADQKHLSGFQSKLHVQPSRKDYGGSTENVNSRGNGSGGRTPDRNPRRTNQSHKAVRSVSASESSPEDVADKQHSQQYERNSETLSRRSSCRRSFQKQTTDQSLYLSADDACLSPWSQQRRYSSESSDASDTSGTSATARLVSQEETEEVGEYCTSLLPSTRRRQSFRSHRTCHFYDVDGSDVYYDAEDQSNNGVPGRSSRRSCSDISQVSKCNELTSEATSPSANQQRSHSPRGSLAYDGVNEERLLPQRKISTQLSDPPSSLSRSHSPRPSIASCHSGSERRSVEREAIRIIIDDVDCPDSCQAVPTPTLTTTSSTLTVRLLRDHHYGGHGFTAGFGLSLAIRKNVVISWIAPHGPADQAGLLCGDIVLSWDGVQLVGWNFEFDDIEEELQHSGDSIHIQVLRNSVGAEALPSSTPPQNIYEHHDEPLMRPNKLPSSILVLDAESSGRSTPPSPTRRRLPQAPAVMMIAADTDSPFPFIYRVQLKFKCSIERNGSVCMVITVVEAERSPVVPQQTHDVGEKEKEHAFLWIKIILTLPSGASRKFLTDKVESSYDLCWNSLFTCSDLTAEEVSRSQLTLSLWGDSFQKGEIKIADTNMDLQNITMDGRPTWFPLRHCNASPVSPRRLCKAVSYDQQNQQNQQQQPYVLSRNDCELNVDHADQSSSSSQQRTPSPPTLSFPRSRSAEICHLLLQPESQGWTNSGLSAPASLAPSRRGSSYNCEDEYLIAPSPPSSRRGSSVFAGEGELANVQGHQKLSASTAVNLDPCALQHHRVPSSQWRSQSFRSEVKHAQHNAQDVPTNRASARIINSSALEFGTGQILPGQSLLARDERLFKTHTESCGQIKLGLIITQGQLEVEVIAARNLVAIAEKHVLPDTYVKATLCHAERVIGVRKTRIVRQTCHPEFHQTLLFDAANALHATLIIEVRLKNSVSSGKSISADISPLRIGDHSTSQQDQSTMGFVHIALDRLMLTTLTISWYKLIPFVRET
ncbi:uncharacterized protein LOC116921958 isoform X2 [Daphnia magna]|uniref:uncharacterized protein LOC116921958 isoform X2 n=1 Tax=Daphnia magna TaxID=35525 RepID=UPI001E1BD138|nr:uncharacterized protein LOC116921958 isoform X2 [Daphnia magna]